MSRFAVLSDEQWARIEPLMPSSAGRPGRPFQDHRRVVEGIVYRYRAGIPWRDLGRRRSRRIGCARSCGDRCIHCSCWTRPHRPNFQLVVHVLTESSARASRHSYDCSECKRSIGCHAHRCAHLRGFKLAKLRPRSASSRHLVRCGSTLDGPSISSRRAGSGRRTDGLLEDETGTQ